MGNDHESPLTRTAKVLEQIQKHPVWTIVAFVLLVVGLSGAPGDIETWSLWIATAILFLESNASRIVAVLLAALIAAYIFQDLWKPPILWRKRRRLARLCADLESSGSYRVGSMWADRVVAIGKTVVECNALGAFRKHPHICRSLEMVQEKKSVVMQTAQSYPANDSDYQSFWAALEGVCEVSGIERPVGPNSKCVAPGAVLIAEYIRAHNDLPATPPAPSTPAAPSGPEAS